MSGNTNNTYTATYVSISSLEWLFSGAEQLCLNIDKVLLDCGLSFNSEDIYQGKINKIPSAAYCKLYYQLNYALQIKIHQMAGQRGLTPEEFKLLCYCLINAEKLEVAIERVISFFTMIRDRFPNGKILLKKDKGQACFKLEFGWGEKSKTKIEIERKTMYLYYFLFSWLIGEPIELNSVQFKYKAQADHPKLIDLFRCNILCEQNQYALNFSEKFLSKPVIRTNAELDNFLEQYPSRMLAPITLADKALTSQLKQIMLNFCLKEGCFPTLTQLAEMYDISESSLGRKLRSENYSYSELRKETMFDLAKQLMWRQELSITDIATILGFSDTNSFSRSFSNWAGTPPSTFRKTLVS